MGLPGVNNCFPNTFIPFRALCHNGEINTLRGNTVWRSYVGNMYLRISVARAQESE